MNSNFCMFYVCVRDYLTLYPVGGASEVGMGDILSFFVGAEDIPQLGFN